MEKTARICTRSYGYLDVYVNIWENSYSVDNNTSSVSANVGIRSSSANCGWSSDYINWTLTNTNGGNAGKYYQNSKGDTTVGGTTWTVTHNADGTGSASASGSISIYQGSASATATLTLTTIPRASVPTVSGNTIGSTVTITTNRSSSSFTHTLSYKFGTSSGTIATNVGASYAWKPSLDLLKQISSSSSGSCTITCVTYSGDTNVGTKSINVTLYAPSYVPTCSITSITENNSYVSAKGSSITLKELSIKTVKASFSGYYGSSITKATITNGTQVVDISSGSCSMSNLTSGTYTLSITDSRGMTNSNTSTQTFYNYYKPYGSMTVVRSSETSSTGTLAATGYYFKSLSNTLTATLYKNNTSQGSRTLTFSNSNETWSYTTSLSNLNIDQTSIWRLTLKDSFNQTVNVTFNLSYGRPTLWLGKDKIKVYGKEIWEIVYPVGAVYISMNLTSPETLFGGTWSRLSGGYLFATAYTSLNTGGSRTHTHTTANHTLTIAEMPKHNHTTNTAGGYGSGSLGNSYFKADSNNPKTAWWWDTNYTGGDGAHSHGTTGDSSAMPPYITCYVWYRTA